MSVGSVTAGSAAQSVRFNESTEQGRIEEAMSFFQSQGWTRAQAAGIVANLQAESRVNPHQAQYGGGPGYGIAQWEGPRQAEFARWAGHDIHGSSLHEQLQFVQYELTHTEAGAGARLRNADSAADAGAIVCRYYERPADTEGQSRYRAGLAQDIYASAPHAPPHPAPHPTPTPHPAPGHGGNVTVHPGDTLSGIAARNHVSLQALLAANPQIHNPNLIHPGQVVHLPGNGGGQPTPAAHNYTVHSGDTLSGIAARNHLTLAALERANPQIHNPNLIYVGQTIHLPGSHSSAPAPATHSYTVRSGDTMSAIAARNHVSLAALLHANPQVHDANRIYPGQKLQIPGHGGGTPAPATHSYTVRSGDTMSAIATRNHVSLAALLHANPQVHDANRIYPGQKLQIPGHGGSAPAPAPAPKPASHDYTVRAGDTMSGIAAHHGVSLAALERANPQISNFNRIQVGQRIHLPGAGGSGPVHGPSGGHGSGDKVVDIARHYLGRNASELKRSGALPMNPNVSSHICCANFVSAVLQKAGVLNVHTDLVSGSSRTGTGVRGSIGQILKARGWHVVDAAHARPGDVAIVNYGHHVELVASNDHGRIRLIGSNNINSDGSQRISYSNPYGNAWYLSPP